jgi:hypothetical protein
MTEDPLDEPVAALVEHLGNVRNAEPASSFPRDRAAVAQPGLYAWWSDEAGLDALSAPFGIRLPPLIYAGQAGATSSRARVEPAATLRSRISTNHLNDNVRSSTFRKTLTATLLTSLELRLTPVGQLVTADNQKLSDWMRRHLRVAIVPYPDRARLGRVEAEVLRRLNPPLNLMGMVDTPIRRRLTRLRTALNTSPTQQRNDGRGQAGSGVHDFGGGAPR